MGKTKTMAFAKDIKSGILHVFASREERDAWVDSDMFGRSKSGEAWVVLDLAKGVGWTCHDGASMPRCYFNA